MLYCMHLTVVKSSRFSPVFFWYQQAHVQMHIFLFFISIYAYLFHQVQQEMGEVLSREWWQSVPYRSFGSWPCKPSQQYLGGRVWVYSLCLCYLPHRSLSSCRRIIYLGQRHVGSVKGESRNARQFLSVVYLLYRRSERQWFLYFRSFSCPSTLASCCPRSMKPALLTDLYPTRWGPSWAVSLSASSLVDAR